MAKNKLKGLRHKEFYRRCEAARSELATIANRIACTDAYKTHHVGLTYDPVIGCNEPLLLSLDLKIQLADKVTVLAILAADVCPFTFDNLDYQDQGNGPYPSLWARTSRMVARVYLDNVQIRRGAKFTYEEAVLEFAKQCSKVGKQLKWTIDLSWPGTANWRATLKELAAVEEID